MAGRPSGADEIEGALVEDLFQQLGRHEVLPQTVGLTGAVVVRGPRQPQAQALGQEANLLALLGVLVAVAEELDRLGYRLQLGREVINADARMGLPSAEALQAQERAERLEAEG